MRIIGGRFKGHKLYTPKGLQVRPTADRVREAIFNIIREQVVGAVVLDLYAGTGALSLEALSRGAKSAVLIDQSPASLHIIQKNIATLQFEAQTQVIKWDITHNLNCLQRRKHGVFHIVFVDAPYHQKVMVKTLTHLWQSQTVTEETLLIIEHSSQQAVVHNELSLNLVDQRRYGKTLVSFMVYML